MMKFLTSIIVFISIPLMSFSQIGAFKRAAQELLKDQARQETEKKRDSYDTLSFNYAIAFLDKTESFENQQKGETLFKAANFLLRDGSRQSDSDAARDIYDFGKLNYKMGNQFLAETNLNLAKLSYEQMNAHDDPNYIKTIGLLGLLYSDMGRYNKADELTKQALQAWADSKGEESIGYLAELNNLSVLLLNQGDFIQAEQVIQELGIKLKQSKEDVALPYAIYLNNLAIFNQYMGRADNALSLMKDCIAKAKAGLTESSTIYMQFLTNEAILEQENGLLDKAEASFLYVIDLQLKRKSSTDPDYAHMQSNIAALYVAKKEYDKAEEALKTALNIYKKKLGSEHLTTAGTQSDLGNLYRYLGRNEEAKSLLQESLYTKERKLSKTHPKVVKGQEDMALWYWENGQIESAKSYYKRVMNTSLNFIEDYFPALSEAEKTKYWEQMKPRFFRFYNFALDNQVEFPELIDDLMKYRLATKGILLSSSTALRNTIITQDDEELNQLYEQWIDQKQQLANAYSLSDSDLKEQSLNIDSLESAANTTEKELSSKSDAFSKVFEESNLDYAQLTDKLEANQALVEIIQFPLFDKSLTDEMAYAFVILKKGIDKPEIIINKNGNQLGGRYYAYYNNVINQKLKDEYSYAQFWQPIESAVGNSSTVFVSTDGIYNQLNLNTIQLPSGQYLIQKLDIRYIGHPNDILYNRTQVAGQKQSAFLMGDPNFNSATVAQLPGTKKEIDDISKYLNPKMSLQKYMQEEATETNLKNVKSPKILHLASHGLFLEDKTATDNLFGVQLQYIRQNPLLRSGLLLTGVSDEQSDGTAQSFNQNDNGFLSAYEAINLNLSNTDLVVLSACETGKGDLKAGEGVYGLQRAFIIAGAQSLVMSLWKVDDTATQKLMSGFYRTYVNGNNLPDSFRQAQLAMLKEYGHPYYWGAFMMYSR